MTKRIKLTEIIDGLYADGLISNEVRQQILDNHKKLKKIKKWNDSKNRNFFSLKEILEEK